MKKNILKLTAFLAGFVLLWSCSDKLLEKPFINPPFPHISPEYTEFNINTEEGGLLEYMSGTKITVPENAWVDSLGNAVSGDIKIAYREFHDAFDIFLSGATMNYDSAGVKGNFTTAGMFEIRAYKDSSEIFIKPGSNLNVRMASYIDDEDYNFYSLNEKEKKWTYQGIVKPEENEEIQNIIDTIAKLKPERAFPFDKEKYFALSADAILDVYFNDNRNLISKNRKSTKPKRKAETYGLSWYNIWGTNAVWFEGGSFEAYQMVWENTSGRKFPSWAKKKYAYIEKLTKIEGNVYYMKIASGEKKSTLRVKAIMPIKYLFAYPPETWQEKYDEIIERIEEEQKRLALQCDVYRSFEITTTGFHNWDKVYKRDDRVLVKSNFSFDLQTDEFADIDVFYFMDNNRSFIQINLSATDTLMLVPDSTAKLIAVLGDKKAGFFSSAEYNKINFAELQSSNTFNFKMKTIDVNSKEDFVKFINN